MMPCSARSPGCGGYLQLLLIANLDLNSMLPQGVAVWLWASPPPWLTVCKLAWSASLAPAQYKAFPSMTSCGPARTWRLGSMEACSEHRERRRVAGIAARCGARAHACEGWFSFAEASFTWQLANNASVSRRKMPWPLQGITSKVSSKHDY